MVSLCKWFVYHFGRRRPWVSCGCCSASICWYCGACGTCYGLNDELCFRCGYLHDVGVYDD